MSSSVLTGSPGWVGEGREDAGKHMGRPSRKDWPEKDLREIFPEMRWVGGAPKLSLLKDQWGLGRDLVGKKDHELRGR